MAADTELRAAAAGWAREGRYELVELVVRLPREVVEQLAEFAADLRARDGFAGWDSGLVCRRIVERWLERRG